MIPVKQTEFGDNGNCLSACLASILEIPVSEVPNFCCVKEHPGYREQWFCDMNNDFLIPRGYKVRCRRVASKGYSIAYGPGPRGWRHACVALDGVVIHDPHPDDTGLIEIEGYFILEPLT